MSAWPDLRFRVVSSIVVCGVLTAAALAKSAQDSTAPKGGDLLQPPQKPLDERIKPDKITEAEPAPLPVKVAVPHPPVHRISADAAQVPIDPEVWRQANEAIKRGLQFLDSKADSRGGWARDAKAAPTDQPERLASVALAVTSLVVKAYAQADPAFEQHEHVRRALRLIRAAQQTDKTFDASPIANYITSSVLQALAAVGSPDDYGLRQDAIEWLQTNQWDQSEGLGPRQDWFGGAGYGGSGRPDMSNTQMMLDALYDAGLSPDEPAFQKALLFISRAQNFASTNNAPWAGGAPPETKDAGGDGGFIYTPANGGESFASEAAGEGRYGEKLLAAGEPRSLRSYGSMTYAGFKSMLYAGLSPDDVRVRAAFDWLRRRWTFDENPGLGQQGLYYYYHTLARALFIAQQHEITDVDGRTHNWREELIAALLKRQRDDGSWVNEADRWMEGDPVLVTTYAVLALEEALKPVRTQ